MATDKHRHDLPQLGSRLGRLALVFATMAACTYAGYKLYGVLEQTRVDRVVADGVSAMTRAVGGFFRMDSTFAMILVPVLIVGGLALGGLYFWNRKGG